MTRLAFVGKVMKRSILGVAFPLALTICLCVSPASADDNSGCTNATVTGSYGSLLTGTIIGFGPIASVGVATYDGAGHWSRTETTNVNGNTLPPETIAGTYNVNADCTGSTQDEQGHASTFVIVNHGKEILVLVTDYGVVLTVDQKK